MQIQGHNSSIWLDSYINDRHGSRDSICKGFSLQYIAGSTIRLKSRSGQETQHIHSGLLKQNPSQ